MSVLVKSHSSLCDYINVLKPKETSLLVYMGACAAIIAAATTGKSFPNSDFILTLIAILMGSAGSNGLTNYLDREVDAKMERTRGRALPSKQIEPATKVLPLIILLISSGLVLSWLIYPICFIIGSIGIVASSVWRKTVTCTYLGIIAGSAPVLVAWYAITKQPVIDIQIMLLFCLIAIWTPLHVWTLMLANRADYEGAGLRYFPLSWKDKKVIKILAVLSFVLFSLSWLIYFLAGSYSWLYLAVANILGILMIYANLRLLFSPSSKNAWAVYKLSAFPYLGILFTTMAIDAWII